MKYLKWFFLLGIVVILLYFFLHNVNLAQVWSVLAGINPVYPLVFAGGLVLQQFLRGLRWRIILRPQSRSLSPLTMLNFTFIGFFINLILPGRVGEPARGVLLARKAGFNQSFGLASVVIERLIDAFIIVCLFPVSLIFLKNSHTPFLLSMRKVAYFALPLIVFLFFTFFMLNHPRVFRWVEKTVSFFSRLVPSKYRQAVSGFIIDFVRSLRLSLSPRDTFKLAVSSLGVWLIMVPFYWILFKPVSININIFESLSYFCIVTASAAIPTPAMAGSLDAGSKLALVNIFQVKAPIAVAYTLLVHMLLLGVTFFGGLMALGVEGLKINSIKKIRN